MKQFWIVTLLLLISTNGLLFSENLVFNGKVLNNSKLVVSENIQMIEVEYFSQLLGTHYIYNPKNRIVILSNNDVTLQMQIGNKDLWIDLDGFEMPLSLMKVNGDIYLPLEFVSQKLGINLETKKMSYASETKTRKKTKCSYRELAYKQNKVRSGLEHIEVKRKYPFGVVSAHILLVDVNDPSLLAKVALAKDSILDKETTSQMCVRNDAVAAMNGAFYADNGDPLGLIIIDGRMVSIPIMKRSAFGLTWDNEIVFGNPDFNGKIVVNEKEELGLGGVNESLSYDKVVVYTSEFGKSTRTHSSAREYAVVRGRVVGIGEKNTVIPPDGFVISVPRNRMDEFSQICLWDRVELKNGMNSVWNRALYGIGGGPRLIKNRQVYLTGKLENFRKDVLDSRAPRSAIGLTEDGKLIMVTVDGRNRKHSVGFTLRELAEFLLEFNCIDALNLDGGGSSTMVVEGKVMNKPSDGNERRVSNAIIITEREKQFVYSGNSDQNQKLSQ